MSDKKEHHITEDNTALMDDADDCSLIKHHEPIMKDYRRSKRTLRIVAESCVIPPEQEQEFKRAITNFVRKRKSDKINKKRND